MANRGAGNYFYDQRDGEVEAARTGGKSAALDAYFDWQVVNLYLTERRHGLSAVNDQTGDFGTALHQSYAP